VGVGGCFIPKLTVVVWSFLVAAYPTLTCFNAGSRMLTKYTARRRCVTE